MKSMIQIVLVALIVGGISAGGSFYWHLKFAKPAIVESAVKPEKKDASADDQGEAIDKALNDNSTIVDDSSNPDSTKPEESELKTDSFNPKLGKDEPFSFGPPVAVRPPFDADADEAGDLIRKLRVRSISASRRERQLQEREEAMKLIVEDLRTEQAKSAKMRKRLFEEQTLSLNSVGEAFRAIDTERTVIQEDLAETRRMAEEKIQSVQREKEEALRGAEDAMKKVREEQDDLRKELDELRKPAEMRDRSGSPEQSANLKKTAGTLDSMPAEDVAKVLQETVKEGRTAAVVAILNAMKPRISAKVISAITEKDPVLAADLVERLKRLKKDGDPPSEK